MGGAKSITDLAKRVEKSWEGGLILKNSLFPTKLLLTEGEMEVKTVNSLIVVPNSWPHTCAEILIGFSRWLNS